MNSDIRLHKLSTNRRQIRYRLKNDRVKRVLSVGEKITTKMNSHRYKESWKTIQGWYRDVTGKFILPTKEQISNLTKSHATLLTADTDNIEHENISSYLQPELGFNVYDDIPDNNEIVDATKKIKNGRCPGPSGLTGEMIKNWLREFNNLDREKTSLI